MWVHCQYLMLWNIILCCGFNKSAQKHSLKTLKQRIMSEMLISLKFCFMFACCMVTLTKQHLKSLFLHTIKWTLTNRSCTPLHRGIFSENDHDFTVRQWSLNVTLMKFPSFQPLKCRVDIRLDWLLLQCIPQWLISNSLQPFHLQYTLQPCKCSIALCLR